jgi:hypothetical protein
MEREALKLALEALKYHTAQTRPIHQTDQAIARCEEALAQPAQEPVANDRALKLVTHLSEQWKAYALELQERLVKYEGGAPMLLNTTTPQPVQEPHVLQGLAAYLRCEAGGVFAGSPNHDTLMQWAREVDAARAQPAPLPVQPAQPAQEPVVFCMHWQDRWGCNHYVDPKEPHPVNAKPLYTTLPQPAQEPVGEALKMALEALEQTLETLDDENAKPGGAIADTIWYDLHITLFDYLASEITAIKQTLAQPAQEPVAWSDEHLQFLNFLYGAGEFDGVWFDQKHPKEKGEFWWRKHLRRLFDAPTQRPWVGLTDEEIDVIYEQHHNQYGECESPNFGYERAIESKLKEKNNG